MSLKLAAILIISLSVGIIAFFAEGMSEAEDMFFAFVWGCQDRVPATPKQVPTSHRGWEHHKI